MSDNCSSKKNKIGVVPGVILAVCQLLIAAVVYFSLTAATSEFRRLGIGMGLFLVCCYTIFVFPVTLLIVMLLVNFQQKYTFPKWITGRAFVFIGFLSICVSLYGGVKDSKAHARLTSEVGDLKLQISDIEVEGFSSIGGSRWLYSFKANNTDVIILSKFYKLEKFDGINLKKMIKSDRYFKEKDLEIIQHIPEEEATLAFAKSDEKNPSRWVNLVYSASLNRAWLYIGFQKGRAN